MTMKKILLLGGSEQQIIAIETAKRIGYYTVLCDYLEDNPGQYHADAFYPVSAADKAGVLGIARKERVSGVLAYASDPAAPVAAYVAEKMGLPGNPYKAMDILCRKDKFREYLASHHFYTPKAKSYDRTDLAMKDLQRGYFKGPVIVKPVDSSGSKGVSCIEDTEEAEKKLKRAMSFSRIGRIIVEEWVEKSGYQVAGDGLSIDGRLVFYCFGNDHFNPEGAGRFVPVAASFPTVFPDKVRIKVRDTIQELISGLGMKACTYNFDIRVDADQNVYLMEVAPRSGGNYIPDVIRHATGVDLVEYAVQFAMGEKTEAPGLREPEGFWSYYALHSPRDGILEKIEIREAYRDRIVEEHLIKKAGDHVEAFTCASSALGCYVMRFRSMEEMLDLMQHPDKWVEVRVR